MATSHPWLSNTLRTRRLALHRLFGVLLCVVGFLCTSLASAAENRDDYDANNNGLIDIVDVADLNEVRNNPEGLSIYGLDPANVGCPTSPGGESVCSDGGCCGFELMNDLDLDTSGNGEFGPEDEFWVDTMGWQPIYSYGNGNISNPTVFEGNGFEVRNLYFGTSGSPVGLFSSIDGAAIKNLRVVTQGETTASSQGTGVLVGSMSNSIIEGSSSSGKIRGDGNSYVMGGLVGACTAGQIRESYATVDIVGGGLLGGLVAYAEDCEIYNSFATGRVESNYDRDFVDGGGLVGTLIDGVVTACFATGNVVQITAGGGLIGRADNALVQASFSTGRLIGPFGGGPTGGLIADGTADVLGSFWAIDLSAQSTSSAGLGYTADDLKCPQSASSGAPCAGNLYFGWDVVSNLAGGQVWNFGNSSQLPGLNIQGTTFRDSDGDGTLDRDDAFPNNWAASIDVDGDGAHDRWKEGCDETCRQASGLVLDNLPNYPEASIDLDLDGMPGAWNASCDFACQQASSLTLDPSRNDYDNDGVPDADDPDDDNQYGPDPDADSDGLIDVESVNELDRMRYDLAGERQYFPAANVFSSMGCPPRLKDGVLVRACRGYELLNDLDFNGATWEAIGRNADNPDSAFSGDFDGNGHVIYNLQVNTSDTQQGLFGGVRDGTIRRVGFSGDMMSVHSDSGIVGALAGFALREIVEEAYSTGSVSAGTDTKSATDVGGLIGSADESVIRASFSTGSVSSEECTSCGVGGLIGTAVDSLIETSFSSASVSAQTPSTGDFVGVGGFIGSIGVGTLVRSSYSIGPVENGTYVGGFAGTAEEFTESCYWARDASGLYYSAGGPLAADLSQMQCPVSDNNTTCIPSNTIYVDWDAYTNESGASYWRYGDSNQLPGLCLGGELYRPDSSGSLQGPTNCGGFQFSLILNPDFENGVDGWTGAYGASIATSTQQAHTGTSSLRISERNSASYQGAEYALLGSAIPGETLNASLWARVAGDPSEPVLFTARSTCQGGSTVFQTIAAATVTDSAWTELNGSVEVPNCALTEFTVYAEGPRTGVVLYIDDVSLTRMIEGTPIGGSFVITNDWGSGYCADLVVTNSSSQPTSSWAASFDLNGSTIYDIWNLDNTGAVGTISVYPQEAWSAVIQPGASSHSLGFCADRAPGGSELPGSPAVTGVF